MMRISHTVLPDAPCASHDEWCNHVRFGRQFILQNIVAREDERRRADDYRLEENWMRLHKDLSNQIIKHFFQL